MVGHHLAILMHLPVVPFSLSAKHSSGSTHKGAVANRAVAAGTLLQRPGGRSYMTTWQWLPPGGNAWAGGGFIEPLWAGPLRTRRLFPSQEHPSGPARAGDCLHVGWVGSRWNEQRVSSPWSPAPLGTWRSHYTLPPDHRAVLQPLLAPWGPRRLSHTRLDSAPRLQRLLRVWDSWTPGPLRPPELGLSSLLPLPSATEGREPHSSSPGTLTSSLSLHNLGVRAASPLTPRISDPQPQSGIPHQAPIPDRAVHCQKHSVWEKRLKAPVL